MQLNTLRTFRVVAEELNITRAAQKLNYSQPTVSKHIQSLENALGTILIEKHKGRYRLTYAGQQVYEHTLNVLREVNAIESVPPQTSAGYTIYLYGHDYYCYNYFLPIIRIMRRNFPMVSFKIECGSNGNAVRNVLMNKSDIAIVSGNILTKGLEYEEIDSEEVGICVRRELYNPRYAPEDYLEHYPVILDEEDYYNSQNIFPYNYESVTVIDSSSDEVVQNAILHHDILGVVRTGRIQENIDRGEVVVLETIVKKEPIYVIRNQESDKSGVSAMYDIIASYFEPVNQRKLNKE